MSPQTLAYIEQLIRDVDSNDSGYQATDIKHHDSVRWNGYLAELGVEDQFVFRVRGSVLYFFRRDDFVELFEEEEIGVIYNHQIGGYRSAYSNARQRLQRRILPPKKVYSSHVLQYVVLEEDLPFDEWFYELPVNIDEGTHYHSSTEAVLFAIRSEIRNRRREARAFLLTRRAIRIERRRLSFPGNQDSDSQRGREKADGRRSN